MQGKLERATPTGETWDSPNGVMDKWDIVINADGRAIIGRALAKQGSQRLANLLGKDVEFQHTPSNNNYPDRIKIAGEVGASHYGGGHGGSGNKKYDSLGPQIGGALKCAVDLYIHGKIQEGEIGGWTMKLVKVHNQVRAALEAESAPQMRDPAPAEGMGADRPPQPPAGNVGGSDAGMSLDDLDRMGPPF